MFDFIVQVISAGGYLGILLLMALENIFPPIPSEMIMPLAGFIAARGELSLTGVILAGTAGSVLGTLPWYFAGKLFGARRLKRLSARHGRWLTVTPDDIDKALKLFGRHGRAAIFFGRLIPAIRTLISIPAGIAELKLLPFVLFSAAGSLLWTGLLTAAGYLLHAKYSAVADYLDPVTSVIVIAIVLAYLYRVITYPRGASR